MMAMKYNDNVSKKRKKKQRIEFDVKDDGENESVDRNIYRLQLRDRKLASSDAFATKLEKLEWLDVSKNHLQELDAFKKISGVSPIKVLNCSHNELHSIDFLKKTPHLKAFVATDNNISEVENCLENLTQLNTMILSKNKIRSIPKSFFWNLSIIKLPTLDASK